MKTIYLADDDEDDRLLIRESIEQIIVDAKIIEVSDGESLLKVLSQQDNNQDSQLILMDMNMPRMNGLEALTILKSDPDYQHIPILMMSTTANHDLVIKAYEQGINAYVVKPVSSQDFDNLVQAIDVCFLHSAHETPAVVPTENVVTESSIIVIEDNDDHRMFIRLALKQSMPHVKVMEFQDKEGTIEFFRKMLPVMTEKPRLILMDLYLPTREEGFELLKSLREFLIRYHLLTVPLIVFSNSSDPEDIRESYQLKANAYMSKAPNASQWGADFSNLHNFWWNTVSYPEKK